MVRRELGNATDNFGYLLVSLNPLFTAFLVVLADEEKRRPVRSGKKQKYYSELGAGIMGYHDKFIHERVAPRLPLSLPGVFIGTQGNFPCIITNLSRTGASIAMSQSLKVGSDGYIRSGPIDRFVTVTRQESGMNGVEFDIPVTDLFVADMRRYHETFAANEREELTETVRSWTTGENKGRF